MSEGEAAQYVVVGQVSRSAIRVWGGESRQVRYGPYKLLANAKRKRAAMNKDRILVVAEDEAGNWTMLEDGNWLTQDKGPWFSRTWIEVAR